MRWSGQAFKGYAVSIAGIRQLAAQARKGGSLATADTYERVADELEAGTLTAEDVADVGPLPRNVRDNRCKAERRRELETVAVPEVRILRGRAVVDQISVALFVGAHSVDFRASVSKLPTDILDRDALAGRKTVASGTKQAVKLTFNVRLLTAEALDTIADNFMKAPRPIAHLRASRLRHLATHLRGFERGHFAATSERPGAAHLTAVGIADGHPPADRGGPPAMSLSPPKMDRPAPPPRITEDDPATMKLPDDNERKTKAQGRRALRIDLASSTANAAAANGGTGLNLPRL